MQCLWICVPGGPLAWAIVCISYGSAEEFCRAHHATQAFSTPGLACACPGGARAKKHSALKCTTHPGFLQSPGRVSMELHPFGSPSWPSWLHAGDGRPSNMRRARGDEMGDGREICDGQKQKPWWAHAPSIWSSKKELSYNHLPLNMNMTEASGTRT